MPAPPFLRPSVSLHHVLDLVDSLVEINAIADFRERAQVKPGAKEHRLRAPLGARSGRSRNGMLQRFRNLCCAKDPTTMCEEEQLKVCARMNP
jgi:hypothetical protein